MAIRKTQAVKRHFLKSMNYKNIPRNSQKLNSLFNAVIEEFPSQWKMTEKLLAEGWKP